MATPVVGDIIESVVKNTAGRLVNGLVDKFLPKSMNEAEKAKFKIEANKLAIEEYRTAIADVQGARELALEESKGAPPWAKILTVTHRPIWSFIMLGIFAWTVVAPYVGYPVIPLTEIHKDIMQTVIIFYFGGRTVEKSLELVSAK
jgi:hypothetical protein